MVEEVEIKNVGDNGVASEVTLKALLAAITKLANNAGMNPQSTVAKVIQQYNTQMKHSIDLTDVNNKEKEKSTKKIKDNTKAVEASTFTFKNMSKVIGVGLLNATGAVTGSLIEISKELFRGGTKLSDFSYHIPFVGKRLTLFTDYLDNSISKFREMSEVGAGFNNDITLMRMTAAGAQMSLNDFSDIVIKNSESLRQLGGTVTTGAQRFATLSNQMKRDPFYSSLKNMGLTIQEVDQGLINYTSLQAKLGTLQGKSNTSLVKGAQGYLVEIDKLAKVTGKSRKELEDQLQQSYQEANLNALRAKLSEAQIKELDAGLLMTKNVLPGFSSAVEDLADGVAQSPLAKTLTSLSPAVADAAAALGKGQISSTQFAEIVKTKGGPALLKWFDSLDASTVQALQGQEGFSELLGSMYEVRKFVDSNFDPAQAAAEQAYRENITNALTTFDDKIKKSTAALQTAFISSGVFQLAGEAVDTFANLVSSPAFIGFLKKIVSTLTIIGTELFSYIKTFISDINNTDIGTAIAHLIGNIFSFKNIAMLWNVITDTIKDAFWAGWDTSPIITVIVAGFAGLFVALKAKNFISGLLGLGGGAAGQGIGAAARATGRGIGAGVAGLGIGVGRGISATLEGIAKGLSAFGTMAVVKGVAVLSAAMITLSAGLTTAAFAFRQFADIKWEDMAKAGVALAALAVPLGLASTFISNIPASMLKGAAIFSAAIGMISVAMAASAFAIKQFDDIKWEDMGKAGVIIAALAVPLALFSSTLAAIPPKALVGVGILAASITILAGAVSAGGYLLSLSMPSIAEGLALFNTIDGTNLKQVGLGMLGLGAGLAVIGGAEIINAVTGFIGWVGSFFGAESPYEKVKKLAELGAPLAIAGPSLERFSKAYIGALASLNVVKLNDSVDITMATLERILEIDKGGTFGGNPPIIDHINSLAVAFANLNTNLPNNTLLSNFATAFSSLATINLENIDTISLSLQELADISIDNIAFSENFASDLASIANSKDGIQQVFQSLENMSKVQGLESISASLALLGGITLNDMYFDSSFMADINSIAGISSGINLTADGLTAISQIQGLDSTISSFTGSLDFNSVDNYRTSIEQLKDALEELNTILAESNDAWTTERVSAGELLKSVGTTNTQTSEQMTALNITLLQILNVLNQTKEIDTKIEKNTKHSGADLSRGTMRMPQ